MVKWYLVNNLWSLVRDIGSKRVCSVPPLEACDAEVNALWSRLSCHGLNGLWSTISGQWVNCLWSRVFSVPPPLEDCDAVVKDLQRHSPPRGGTLRSMIKWCRIKDLWLRACSFTGLQERYASVDGMHRTSPGGM